MKKMKWFSLALAALVLGACSSSDDVVDAGNTGQPQWNADGTGYINLAINLPTTQGTRATDPVPSPNDNWDDGIASEYDVKNATLILFTKSGTETDFKVNSAYDLTKDFSLVGSNTDAITSTANISTAINQVAAGTELKALVVLNDNGLIDVDGTNLKVNNTTFTGTLSELNNQIQTAAKNKNQETTWHNTDNGFLMANALLYTAPGEDATTAPSAATNAKLFVLADIDGNKIYSTKAEAEANPATNIFVERVEAKVQVSVGDNANGSFTGSVGKDPTATTDQNGTTTTTSTTCKYQILGWWLDNTNTTSKLTRDENEFTDNNSWLDYKSDKMTPGRYRMVGGKTVGEGTDGSSYYRVYWGKDHNYASTETHSLKTETTEPTNLKPTTGTNYDYCFENTTDVDAMTEENVTRVIIKAKLVTDDTTPADIGDFYTINNNHNTIYSLDNVKKQVTALLLKELDMQNWINKNKKENETVTSEDFTVTISNTDAGVVKVTAVSIEENSKNKFNDNASLSTLTDPNSSPSTSNDDTSTTQEDYVVTLANKGIVLNYYKGGETYYYVWIKHFGDEYTPWEDNGAHGGGTTTGGVYGTGDDAKNNYLGRYGVLRNNWYQIEVTGIKAIGSPTVTPSTETPVDKVESHIACRINILPWAIRKQQVEL